MMYGRKGLEPLAMPMAAWLAWLESASSVWSAMSIPATAPARLQELLQINGRLTAERDALLAAAEQARDAAKAQLAALQLDADAVTRNLDESRAQAASPQKSASPVERPSSSSGPRARRGVRRRD